MRFLLANGRSIAHVPYDIGAPRYQLWSNDVLLFYRLGCTCYCSRCDRGLETVRLRDEGIVSDMLLFMLSTSV